MHGIIVFASLAMNAIKFMRLARNKPPIMPAVGLYNHPS